MKKMRIACLLLALCLLLTGLLGAVNADDSAFTELPSALRESAYPADLSVDGKAAALIELNSGEIVFAQDIDRAVYPASLTKIMTCMLALRYGNLDDELTVSEEALADQKRYELKCTLLVGEKMTLRELLYCTMVASVNEACNVIAEYIAGDIESFVAMMNAQAAQLGMDSTTFRNAHGLHDAQHVTTVRDLATLARWAWNNEQFREFCTTTKHTVPATNLSKERTLKTTNYLVSKLITDRYYYSLAEGIKTGYTSAAGGCLISTASRGNVEFLSIFCGGKTVANDDGTYTDMRFVESKKMLQYGVENYTRVQVLSTLVMSDQTEVLYAAGRGNVVVHPAQDVSVLLPAQVDPEKIEIRVSYDGGRPEAPLAQGERVGTVQAVYEGTVLAETDLVTLTAVERQSNTGTKPTQEAPTEPTEPSESEPTEPAPSPAEPTAPEEKRKTGAIVLLVVLILAIPVLCVIVLRQWNKLQSRRKRK